MDKEIKDILFDLKVNINTDDLYQYTCEARVFKLPHELEQSEQACILACHAHKSAWKFMKPGLTENQISNHIYSYCQYYGDAKIGYENIVASGRNAAILHYPPSTQVEL